MSIMDDYLCGQSSDIMNCFPTVRIYVAAIMLLLCACGSKSDQVTERALAGSWVMCRNVAGSGVVLSDTITFDLIDHRVSVALGLSLDSTRLSYLTVAGSWSTTATDISIMLDRESVRMVPGHNLSQRIGWTDFVAGLSSDDFRLLLGICSLSSDSLIVIDRSSLSDTLTYRFLRPQ